MESIIKRNFIIKNWMRNKKRLDTYKWMIFLIFVQDADMYWYITVIFKIISMPIGLFLWGTVWWGLKSPTDIRHLHRLSTPPKDGGAYCTIICYCSSPQLHIWIFLTRFLQWSRWIHHSPSRRWRCDCGGGWCHVWCRWLQVWPRWGRCVVPNVPILDYIWICWQFQWGGSRWSRACYWYANSQTDVPDSWWIHRHWLIYILWSCKINVWPAGDAHF